MKRATLLFAVLILVFFLTSCKKSSTASNADNKHYVAVFYFANYGSSQYAQGALAPTGDAWIVNGQTPAFSPYGLPNFWGKPLFAATHGDGTIKNNYRFYFNDDPAQTNDSLLDWHARLLSDADVDLIVLDFTNGAGDFPNGPSYLSATTALCNRWRALRRKGVKTPQIAFFVRNATALSIVEDRFFNQYDASLFFHYLGKKLVLVARPNDNLENYDPAQPAVPTAGIFANYTARHCWGNMTSGTCWQFKVNSNPPPSPFMYNGQPEQLCAPVADQLSYMTTDGINVTQGAQGRQNGDYFSMYMNAAATNKVKFVFIHSWNEWNAGNWGTQDKPYFVDLWNQEYSADIEPMYGGHGDQYYQLMKSEIAKFRQAVNGQ